MDFRLKKLPGYLFTLMIIISLVYGWMHRDSNYISAESGIGYAMGIIGGSLMLILLMYPVSKRVKRLTRLIPLRYWFGIHMAFGVLGPVLILFHSNFQLGSINSNVALFCMLLVAGSGLFGKYFYTHIHHGLYGKKIALKELKDKLSDDHQLVIGEDTLGDELHKRLQQLEQKTVEPYTGVFSSISHVISLSIGTRSLRRDISDQISGSTATALPAGTIDHYFSSLKRIAAFRLYERLFALWHVFHLPLFFMMLITAVVHIFAVHLY